MNPEAEERIIDILEGQDLNNLGGTLRLGDYKCDLVEGTLAHEVYGADSVLERHRHRYEINKEYIPEFEKNGLIFSANSDDGKRMEILEIPSHKFYLGVQFHPEFNSRPGFPEEAFSAFIKASSEK
mgnify:CR=1 FL=1